MSQPKLQDLTAFIMVASKRSFRQAADEMNVAPSSLSHTVRGLEEQLGVRLFNRTTRSVSLTEAGQNLLDRLAPALRQVDAALGAVDPFRAAPSGVVRINAPEVAAAQLLEHVVPEVLQRYPEVSVDLVAEGRFVDIVAEGFDAGIRLGEAVPQDMVAVRFGGQERFIAVASPDYLDRVGVPIVPDDLRHHACICHRMPSGKLYRWEFSRRNQEIAVDVPGRLTLDRLSLMVSAARAGLGIAYVPQTAAETELRSGALKPVLADWSPWIAGLYLYYPGHRQVPSALRAFIDTMKEVMPERENEKAPG